MTTMWSGVLAVSGDSTLEQRVAPDHIIDDVPLADSLALELPLGASSSFRRCWSNGCEM